MLYLRSKSRNFGKLIELLKHILIFRSEVFCKQNNRKKCAANFAYTINIFIQKNEFCEGDAKNISVPFDKFVFVVNRLLEATTKCVLRLNRIFDKFRRNQNTDFKNNANRKP